MCFGDSYENKPNYPTNIIKERSLHYGIKRTIDGIFIAY